MSRVVVYLSRHSFRSRSGYVVNVAECRLWREHPSDQVIAVIKAPFGSRIRLRSIDSGQDELLVRRSPWPWTWFFGGSIKIPAKYLVEDARRQAHGLSLISTPPKVLA